VLATVAAARTGHAAGSLVAGYRLSFLVATGFAVLAGLIVAVQFGSRSRPIASQAPAGGASARL
jgi:hypothetical protein